jgi:hypothetical protein
MVRYLIDANLPYRFSIWNNEEYVHQAEASKILEFAWGITMLERPQHFFEYRKRVTIKRFVALTQVV